MSGVRALASPKLLLWFDTTAACSATLVLLGNEAGFWHMSATKATVYWFFGTAVVLVGSATKLSPDDAAAGFAMTARLRTVRPYASRRQR